jgi:trimethylamine corrinoid protein
MNSEQWHASLQEAIVEGDAEEAADLARQLLSEGGDLLKGVETATEAIRQVGDSFGEGVAFLPELVLAADAMQAFMDVIKPELEGVAGAVQERGKIVMATVKGDIHSIGKNIVATMLKAGGYEVIDLGVNVAPMDMIDTAERSGAKIIGLSALMTTSMPYQQEVVQLLKELGARDKFWVMVGGGPVTSEFAAGIGADGWARDAGAAVRVADRMLASAEAPAGARLFSEEG